MKALLQRSVNMIPPSVRGSIKHIPGIAGLQRWLVNNLLSGQRFVHTVNAGPAAGLRIEISLPADKAIWIGMFEPEFSSALHAGVRPGDVCYDIGGYRGYMSGVMGLAGAAQVVVFEPLNENVAALRQLAALNPALHLRIEQTAVGASDGEAEFQIMPDRSMGKLTTSPFQAGTRFEKSVAVPLGRLDALIFEKGFPRPNLLKIDVEGAEADVLRGAQRTLAECRPRVLLEVHSEALGNDCRQLLSALGYRVRQLERDLSDPAQTRHFVAEPQ